MKSLRRNNNGARLNGGRRHAAKNGASHNGDTLKIQEPKLESPDPNTRLSSEEIQSLERQWRGDSRWSGVTRNYTAEKVLRLRGTMNIEHTLAQKMSRKLWHSLHTEPYINALGALTGNQAVQ